MTSLMDRAFGNKAPVAYAASNTPRSFSTMLGLNRGNKVRQMESMGSVGTLFSIVELISESMGAIEWKLYRKSDGRGKISGDDRREVLDHSALTVWNKPNNFYTGQQFRETLQQHIELSGENCFFPVLDERMPQLGPIELWPVRPDRITPIPSRKEFIAGYEYRGVDGETVPFKTNEVLRMLKPDPIDPYRGMSVVQALMADLESTKYAAQWNRNFFLNSAQPGGIIEVPERLSEPQFDELVSRWNEQHRGVSRAHRVAFLEQGKWVDNSYSMKDMQFVQMREISRDVVMEGFRIHKHMLGISDDVNRANAVAADYTFAKRLIVPRANKWRDLLNTQYLPLFGTSTKGLEFDYSSPVGESEEEENAERDSKVKALVALVAQGADPVEACKYLELPPMSFTKSQPAVQPAQPAVPQAPGTGAIPDGQGPA